MTFSVLELLVLLAAGLRSESRADTTTHPVPFDTVLAVATTAHLALDVETGAGSGSSAASRGRSAST